MDNIWFASALWIGLALIAASMQAWVAVSVALLEIIIGAVAGNLVDLKLTQWVNYLAGFGAILLTFLAGAEIDVNVIRRNFASTMAIGAVGFFAPYLGVLACAHFVPAGRGHRLGSPASRCPPPPLPWSTRSWSRPGSTTPRSARSSWWRASSMTSERCWRSAWYSPIKISGWWALLRQPCSRCSYCRE